MKGLSGEKAEELLSEHGPNVIEKGEGRTRLDVLIGQLKNLLVWILFAAAVISLVAGKTLTFYFVIVILLIVVVTGFLQEWRAEEAMDKLEDMHSQKVSVFRDGELRKVESERIVPGDVVRLERGDKVAADGKVQKQTKMELDEAAITGESSSVSKEKGEKVFSGTTVVNGRGEVEVTETGMETELGTIAEEVKEKEDRSPLQRRVDRLAKQLSVAAILACSSILLLGFLQAEPLDEVLIVSLSLIVATVPEALPLTLTLTLSSGMRDMAERNVIVKKMLAVEALGSTTTICTDKTGTLTKNEMTVKKLYFDREEADVEGTGYRPEGKILKDGEKIEYGDSDSLDRIIETAALCNNSELWSEGEEYRVSGDRMEGALSVLVRKAGINEDEMEERNPREHEILFTSERKMMTTVNRTGEGLKSHVKGAPEVLLERCSHHLVNGDLKELDEEAKEKIIDKNEEFAQEALRVLGFAYRDGLEESFEEEEAENNLVFVGMAGMIDPPREEAKNAIQECEEAGIDVKMITGDNAETAKAIARRIDLTDSPTVLTGDEIEELSHQQLSEKIGDIDIYARTRPEHKYEIVEAFKENGEIVAMTGDGVNDAPAVKKADVGIGMGQKGTDVTRESSDIILKDDNFSSIVAAVKDGRRIYENIEKFTTYLLSRNFTEVTLIALGMVFLGFEFLPLIALQILFINVIGEELPALSLGVDSAREGIMERPPRDPERNLLNTRNMFLIGSIAGFMALTAFIVFLLVGPRQDLALARTVTFASIVLMVIIHTFNFKSLEKSITKIDLLENRLMLASVLIVAPLLFAAVYMDGFASVFDHRSMRLNHWAYAGSGALLTLFFIESAKKMGKRIEKPAVN